MGNKDRLVIDIALDTGNKDLPLEFFICRKKDVKLKNKDIEHLKDFVKPSNAKNYKLTDK